METSSLKWLFFDLGSTLVDESYQEENIFEEVQKSCQELGISIGVEVVREKVKYASVLYEPSIIKYAIKSITRNRDEYQYIIDKVEYLPDLERVFPDSKNVLETLSEKYKIGIIANQAAGAEERLSKHGLRDLIDLFVLSSESKMKKPDPEIFLLALSKAGCTAEKAVMIGDRLDNDIYPAKQLGFKTIRILRGFGQYQIPKSSDYEADYSISELGDLIEIFM